jgi:hypothetical protein
MTGGVHLVRCLHLDLMRHRGELCPRAAGGPA